MNIKIDIAAAILSVFTIGLSALISYLVARKQKHLEYVYDYKKYILKKRQEAYERVDKVIRQLSVRVRSNVSNKPNFNMFVAEAEKPVPIHGFTIEIVYATTDSFWFSDKLLNLLVLLNNEINTFISKWSEEPTIEHLAKIGEDNYETLEMLRREIFAQYFEDLRTLDNIDKFIAGKTHY